MIPFVYSTYIFLLLSLARMPTGGCFCETFCCTEEPAVIFLDAALNAQMLFHIHFLRQALHFQILAKNHSGQISVNETWLATWFPEHRFSHSSKKDKQSVVLSVPESLCQFRCSLASCDLEDCRKTQH